jgi:hypothetical protein
MVFRSDGSSGGSHYLDTAQWRQGGLVTYTYPTAAPASTGPVTGVNPIEESYSLYGHVRILLVLGRARIGGEILSGPWLSGGNSSGIVGFGVDADPSRIRTLKQIAFDSEVVWEGTQVGAGTLGASSGFVTEPFTCRFYDGKLDQAADSLEIDNFGTNAVAYRPEILLAIETLPLANTKFGKFPYVSIIIEDEDGEAINFGEAFERLAESPFTPGLSGQFETDGITDGVSDGALIFAQDAEFLGTLQQFGYFYPNWDILQTDKLRLVDRGGNVTADITLDATRLMEKVTISIRGQDSIRRDLELSTPDPEADYSIVPYKVQRPHDPVTVTTSVGVDTRYLPVVMDSSTRAVVATFAKYYDENARKTISGRAMASGLEIEPGALVEVEDLSDEFGSETFKVVETSHFIDNSVEFTAQAMLRCETSDPHAEYVVLLMGFEDDDGSQGAPGLTDESPSLHGTADIGVADSEIDTAQFKFGLSSFFIDGFLANVEFPPSIDWELSGANSDQFTVECWVRLASLPVSYGTIVGKAFGALRWDFSILSTGEFHFRFVNDAAATVTVASTTAALTTGTWYHLAVDKSAAGKIRLYKDGVMIASATPANSTIAVDDDILVIGAFDINKVPGWLDELRITKGVARYATDGAFTVPTAAFPRPE